MKVTLLLDLLFLWALTFLIGKFDADVYQNWRLWLVNKGPYIPITAIDWKSVVKTEYQYTQKDFARLSKNYKAMHILYYGLDANEYNRSVCETVKEI